MVPFGPGDEPLPNCAKLVRFRSTFVEIRPKTVIGRAKMPQHSMINIKVAQIAMRISATGSRRWRPAALGEVGHATRKGDAAPFLVSFPPRRDFVNPDPRDASPRGSPTTHSSLLALRATQYLCSAFPRHFVGDVLWSLWSSDLHRLEAGNPKYSAAKD